MSVKDNSCGIAEFQDEWESCGLVKCITSQFHELMTAFPKVIISNAGWRFAERISAQLVSFFVSIILARLLLPEEYGIVAIIDMSKMIWIMYFREKLVNTWLRENLWLVRI